MRALMSMSVRLRLLGDRVVLGIELTLRDAPDPPTATRALKSDIRDNPALTRYLDTCVAGGDIRSLSDENQIPWVHGLDRDNWVCPSNLRLLLRRNAVADGQIHAWRGFFGVTSSALVK